MVIKNQRGWRLVALGFYSMRQQCDKRLQQPYGWWLIWGLASSDSTWDVEVGFEGHTAEGTGMNLGTLRGEQQSPESAWKSWGAGDAAFTWRKEPDTAHDFWSHTTCLLLQADKDQWALQLSSAEGITFLTIMKLWGCRIVWCTLTSWYLVSLLPVSIIHVSDIFLVGFWSWGISFIMWGCRGWGWQAAGTWVSVSCEMVGFPAPIGWPGASQSICTQ